MGCVMSQAEKEAAQKSHAIDKTLASENGQKKNEVKLLLLGAGESGKSTFVKQMKIIHESGFNKEECKQYRPVVYSNAIQSLAAIIKGMDLLGINFASSARREDAMLLFEVTARHEDTEPFTPELLAAMKRLWGDTGQPCDVLLEAKGDDSVFEWLSSSNAWNRCSVPESIHTVNIAVAVSGAEGHLRTRVKSTGIVEYEFSYKGLHFRVVDVGGQRSERKKWIHCFEDVTAILFFVALSEYDMTLREDAAVNRMEEALRLFNSILNNKWFLETSVILFLNKKDLFEEKLRGKPLSHCFPDYMVLNQLHPPSRPERRKNGDLVVFANRYKVESKLGSGAFGRVLKKIVVTELQPDETVDAVREAKTVSKDHPAIVRFHDSFMEKDVFCIVTEYSLKYIHERGLWDSRILMGTSDLATTFTGTPYYMSPEVLKQTDNIKSLGAVLYELCTLQHAFQGRLMNKDPSKRPTAVEILQDSYVHSHLEGLSHKVLMKLTTASKAEEEAEAIARALQKMQQRKQRMADEEAEDRKRLAAKNYSESKQRYHEKKKREGKVVPPWVEEHPDVFKDADFSSTVSDNTVSDMEVSQPAIHVQPSSPPPQPQLQEVGDIPDDPLLAETHYSQFDDFEAEADSSSSQSEDDLEAFLGCINDALDMQAPVEMAVEPPQLTCHEDISPFTPIARDKRIQLLRLQCQQIYGEESFQKVYEYMKRARSGSVAVNEEVLMTTAVKR
eukprot:Em0018g1142a